MFWCSMSVKGGLLAAVFAAVIVYVFIKNAFRMFKYQSKFMKSRSPESVFGLTLLTTLGSGVIISMFEPNALLGSFQNSALWWVAAGAAAALVKSSKFSTLEKSLTIAKKRVVFA